MNKIFPGINTPAGPVRDPIFIAANGSTLFCVPLGMRYSFTGAEVLNSAKRIFHPYGVNKIFLGYKAINILPLAGQVDNR